MPISAADSDVRVAFILYYLPSFAIWTLATVVVFCRRFDFRPISWKLAGLRGFNGQQDLIEIIARCGRPQDSECSLPFSHFSRYSCRKIGRASCRERV